MGCACSDKKKLDYNYVKRLANAESITKQIDVQIYFIIGYDGKTKYYDYEPTNGGRKLQVVETIQFQQPESISILSDNEQSGLNAIVEKEIIEPTIKSKRIYIRKLDENSGTVLPID